MAGTKTVTVLVMVATGSKFEKKADSGLSHFLEHMFFKGTVKRPNTLAISSELDRVGGEFNAFTGKEYTGYFVKVEAGRLELALDVLSDILFNSKFVAEEIEREKGVIIEELNMYLDNPLIHIEDLFEECLYGDTPAGRDTIGTKKTILSFNRRRLLGYVGAQYQASRSLVCLAGRLKPSVAKTVEKYFGVFPSQLSARSFRDKIRTADKQTGPKIKLRYKKTDQAHLSLGVRALPYGHNDEAAVKVLAALLGGTMSSRLFTELRERRGLAYYVRTHHEAYTDSGYLTTQAGVPIDKLEQSVKIILDEYKKLSGQPVSGPELDKVKQCLTGRSALQLELSDTVANWYGRQAILYKEQKQPAEILTPEKYYALIKKVTAADVKRVAEKIFVDRNLNLVVIGPYRPGKDIKRLKLIARLGK